MSAHHEPASESVGIRGLIRELAPCFRPYSRLLVLIGLALLVEAAFNAFLPLSFSILIDSALIPRDKTVLVIVLLVLGAGVVITGGVGVARDRIYARLTASVIADLRLRIFEHLQRLSADFYARMQLGDVLARFSGDLVALEGAFVSALPWAVAPALDVCVYTVVLFVLDWRLALIGMLVWPVALLGPRYFAPRAVVGSYEKKRLESQTLSVVQENVSGQSVVKAFGLESSWLDSFGERNSGLRRSTAHVAFLGSLVERSAITGVLVLDVAIVAVGSWLSFDGSLSIGRLVAFQGVFLALGYGLSYVTQYMPGLIQGLGGFRHISELFEHLPQVSDAEGSVPLPGFSGEIRFDGVTFGYSEPEAPSPTATHSWPAHRSSSRGKRRIRRGSRAAAASTRAARSPWTNAEPSTRPCAQSLLGASTLQPASASLNSPRVIHSRLGSSYVDRSSSDRARDR